VTGKNAVNNSLNYMFDSLPVRRFKGARQLTCPHKPNNQ